MPRSSNRGQGGEEVVLGRGEAAAGAAFGHVRGEPAVDLGVARVAEAQLDPGAEQVADAGAEVHPPASRDDDVDAEGEARGWRGR